jgi:PAS domain S-box-containing protein
LPEFREDLDREIADALAGDGKYDVEFQIKRINDGAIRWVYSKANLDRESNQLRGYIQDITDRMKVMMALVESETKENSIFERMPIPYHSLNPKMLVMDVNPAWLDEFGYSRDQVIGRPLSQFIAESNVADFEKMFRSQHRGALPCRANLTFKHHDGQEIDVFYTGIAEFTSTDELLRSHCCMYLVSDISDLEAQLHESNRKFKQHSRNLEKLNSKYTDAKENLALHRKLERAFLLNETKSAFVKMLKILRTEFDVEIGMFATVNAAGDLVCQAKQAAKALIIKKTVGQIHRRETLHETWRNALEAGDVTLVNARTSLPDNSLTLENLLFVPIMPKKHLIALLVFGNKKTGFNNADRSKAREIASNLATILKVTLERSRATDQLSQANKELEAFTYAVSHDLKAPVRQLRGFTKMLLEDYSKNIDEQGVLMLSSIGRSAEQFSKIIDSLLRLSRVQRQKIIREELDLSLMAEGICKKLNNENHQVDFKIEPDMKLVADRNLMNIALDNLLNNAWKFTSKVESPKISVSMSKNPARNITTVVISDNGAGFNADNHEKLFDPFYRDHNEEDYSGTGIGLSTVKRIISSHGGKVWAEGDVDKGATFYFTIPD